MDVVARPMAMMMIPSHCMLCKRQRISGVSVRVLKCFEFVVLALFGDWLDGVEMWRVAGMMGKERVDMYHGR